LRLWLLGLQFKQHSSFAVEQLTTTRRSAGFGRLTDQPEDIQGDKMVLVIVKKQTIAKSQTTTVKFKRAAMIACISMIYGSVSAFAEDAPPTDCDTYAASNLDPQKKGAGVTFDEVDPAKAIPACLDALSQYPNTPRFQFQLGRPYQRSGDDQQAVTWTRKAAEQGFALAERNLGVSYVKGRGVPKDAVQAVAWFRKAAEQGVGLAEVDLGISYEDGNGDPRMMYKLRIGTAKLPKREKLRRN
jgi:Sel1 repeat